MTIHDRYQTSRHLLPTIALVGLLVASSSLRAQVNTEFHAGCPLPFDAIAEEHVGVDDYCGIEGETAVDDTGNQQQNRIKNDFCLKGDPVVIAPNTLVRLQKRIDQQGKIKYGSGRSTPVDRTPLQDVLTVSGEKIGEGSLITMVGYVVDPHYADVSNGEGVNCKESGDEPNDIHFSISSRPVTIDYSDKKASKAQLCKLVTAEISPHFRPAEWEVDQLDDLGEVQVRLKGQLFFDASHKPCSPGKNVNPARASVWEIHPIYSIDVCKSGGPCRATVDADWTPLDKWEAAKGEVRPDETEDDR